MIVRRNFFRQLLGLMTTALVPISAWADPRPKGRSRDAAPTPTPDPAAAGAAPDAAKAPGAHLRLWKASDSLERKVQIRLLLPGKPDSEALSPLKVEDSYYQFSNYVDVPAGSAIAEVSAPGRTTVLLPLQLLAGSQSTLLVRAQGESLTAEWLDDTPSPGDSGYEFRIYNLLPASGEIQIDLGTILTAHLSSTRSSLRMNGIKRALYPVVANGVDANGKNFHWNTDADLRQSRKVTLLIYPDAYGRIRPRINAI